MFSPQANLESESSGPIVLPCSGHAFRGSRRHSEQANPTNLRRLLFPPGRSVCTHAGGSVSNVSTPQPRLARASAAAPARAAAFDRPVPPGLGGPKTRGVPLRLRRPDEQPPEQPSDEGVPAEEGLRQWQPRLYLKL